jgi:polyisoprenoid-binding protein YceI
MTGTAWRVALCAFSVAAELALSSCVTRPGTRPPVKAGRPGVVSPAPAATVRYAIDSQRSQVLVLVYRDGPMAHLGHNHVIAVRELTGSVLMAGEPTQTTFAMDFAVEAMSVDDPTLRASLGPDFQSTVDEAAVAGTRDHMLGAALLNSKQYSRIHLQSLEIRKEADGLHALTSIVVRDVTAQAEIPVSLQNTGDDLMVSGEFDLTHRQLGLSPYSVALGALRVAERMHVQYRLVAHRQP